MLVGLATSLVLLKATYAPVCMGYLLISNEVLPLKKKLLSFIPLLVGVVVYLAWSGVYGDMLAITNVGENIGYALTHPLQVVIRIAFNFLAVLEGAINTAPNEYVFFAVVVGVVAACSLLLARMEVPAGVKMDYRFVIGSCIAGLSSFFLVMLFLLLTWNDANAEGTLTLIQGFQGRYLLPLFPLVCYAQTLFYGGSAHREDGAGAADGSELAGGAEYSAVRLEAGALKPKHF